MNLEFFTNIKEFFESLVNFGASVLSTIGLIPRYFNYMLSAIANLPWFISGTLSLLLGVAIVRLVIGIIDFIKL